MELAAEHSVHKVFATAAVNGMVQVYIEGARREISLYICWPDWEAQEELQAHTTQK
jgi:hypothetical protein